jgi:hypothetical protein
VNVKLARKRTAKVSPEIRCEDVVRHLVLGTCNHFTTPVRDASLIALQAVADFLAKTRKLKPSYYYLLESVPNSIPFVERERVLRFAAETISRSSVAFSRAEDLGRCWEGLYGALNTKKEHLTNRGTNARRDDGVYYTPKDLTDLLSELTLGPILATYDTTEEILKLRILDPAVGVGYFLIAAFRTLCARANAVSKRKESTTQRRRILKECLFGVDRDAIATAVTRLSLWLELGDPLVSPQDLGNIRCGDSLISVDGSSPHGLSSLREMRETGFRSFEWRNEFSSVFERRTRSGFDVVLSNPPWGKVKAEAREFFSHQHPRSLERQGHLHKSFIRENVTSRDKEAYDANDRFLRAYLQCLRVTPSYRAVFGGAGDVDYYTLFIQRISQLIHENGRLGLVIPGSFLRSAGTAAIRKNLLASGHIDHLLEFENRERIFPIHGMFKFLLWTYSRGPRKGIKQAIFGLKNVTEARSSLDRQDRSINFSLSFLLKTSKKWLALPELRNSSEQRLFLKLHSAHPPLGERDPAWNVKFVRELDMTNDSEQFIDASVISSTRGRELLPVYEGRLVHQFDSAAKAYIGGHGRRAVWTSIAYSSKVIKPHYYVAGDDFRPRRPRAGFCDITGDANERTVLVALIPGDAVCGNKIPVCEFDPDVLELHLIWMAIANSFVIDWLVRRRITTTLNFFHWRQIPFPRISPSSELGMKLTKLSAELSFSGDPFSTTNRRLSALDACRNEQLTELNASQRAERRAEIDALVASEFHLSPEEMEEILMDFESLDRGQRSPRGRKLEITRDYCMLRYCQLLGCDPDRLILKWADCDASLASRVHHALDSGFIPYLPSQLGSVIFKRRQQSANKKR